METGRIGILGTTAQENASLQGRGSHILDWLLGLAAGFAAERLQRGGRCHETEIIRSFRQAFPKYAPVLSYPFSFPKHAPVLSLQLSQYCVRPTRCTRPIPSYPSSFPSTVSARPAAPVLSYPILTFQLSQVCTRPILSYPSSFPSTVSARPAVDQLARVSVVCLSITVY
jgi:hypothetical protein